MCCLQEWQGVFVYSAVPVNRDQVEGGGGGGMEV